MGSTEANQQGFETWLYCVYGHGHDKARPTQALHIWQEYAALWSDDPYAAAAAGDQNAVDHQIRQDAGWVNRPGGRLQMPPLVAVTHSGLLQIASQSGGLMACARLLLDHGADPNSHWIGPDFPDSPLSALYGAAGKNHHQEMTQLLLARGATPNDNESLYHSVESADIACTRLLLAAGARVEGTNALKRALDFDRLEPVRLLLEHGGDPNEGGPSKGALFHAVRRGRSVDCVKLLIEAGADIDVVNQYGFTPYGMATLYGLTEAAQLLRTAAQVSFSKQALFVAACSRADRKAVRQLLEEDRNLLAELPDWQLRILPTVVTHDNESAVEVMLEAGWPVAVRGGDWDASALNLAVFQGNASLTRLLLRHGASWKERHGFNDNAMGTLAFASRNNGGEYPSADWLGCAKALVAHGMPLPPPEYNFSDELAAYFRSLG